tara:strand:- start:8462 stop:9367 length:906 start_codon:yes stop_codon:yes gene_type:complete
MFNYNLNHLSELESEAIFVIREVAANFEKPVILFSGGKDSIILTHIAQKAFYPSNIPFSLVHIDTGHNFPEVIKFRDNFVKKIGVNLIVSLVQDAIDKGLVKEELGINSSRNLIQIQTLLECIDLNNIDAAIGGARRDEEKARAKERFFSVRDSFGQWDPKNQRPELWNLFNTKKNFGEHFRIFPLSNWTEMDVWNYIKKYQIEIPSLYFSHKRDCVIRDNVILAKSKYLKIKEGEKSLKLNVRYRTCGDMPITGAVESEADTLDKVINEISTTTETERGNRADDKRGETSMEDRKKIGYF